MTDDGPPDEVVADDGPPDGASPLAWAQWLLRTRHPGVRFVREVLSSVLLVLLFGVLLFGVSGVWPPMVAVESGSMQPHMHRGDLVFVMEEHRLAPDYAVAGTGVVTARIGGERGYRKFGDYGDVVVFRPDGGKRTPVIHRAMFWVNESENWYDKADPDFLAGDSCSAVPNCPAPRDGFITKGDNNPYYDQVSGISEPVNPAWIKGTAEVRIPLLGYVRLEFSEFEARGASPAASGV